jgi:hypothetical protein
MGIATVETQVTWSSATTKAVTPGGTAMSDAFTFNSSAVRAHAAITVKAAHAGTPVATEQVNVKLLFTNGDPDADPESADEYDTSGNGYILGVVDMYPGSAEDPAIKTFPFPANAKAAKLWVESTAGSDNVTVSAQLRVVEVT